MKNPVVVACERGAWGHPEIKDLRKKNAIEVMAFPYDEGDRRWHDNRKIPFAKPSLVTADTTELRVSDDIFISDMCGSELFSEIERILGSDRRADVRHFDSTYKSDIKLFITSDTDFSNKRAELHELTGIEVINPSCPKDMERLRQIIADAESTQT